LLGFFEIAAGIAPTRRPVFVHGAGTRLTLFHEPRPCPSVTFGSSRCGGRIERFRAFAAHLAAATLSPRPDAIETSLRRVQQVFVVGRYPELEVAASVALRAQPRTRE